LPMSTSPSCVSPCFPHENPMVLTSGRSSSLFALDLLHPDASPLPRRLARPGATPFASSSAWPDPSLSLRSCLAGCQPKKRAAGRVKLLVHAIIFW
jgi:hypothetical protein